MEDLPLGRNSALVPEFAVNDLFLGRTLMIIMIVLSEKGVSFSVLFTLYRLYCIVRDNVEHLHE